MPFKGSAGPVNTVAKLASALRLPVEMLLEVSLRSAAENYKPVTAPMKKNGQRREVYSPSPDVRLIQRRIVNTFFRHRAVISWPEYIFGGIHKDSLEHGDVRDHVACARRHCGARSILKVDIEDFFGNVTEDHVFGIFTEVLRWSPDVARLVTSLCTRNGVLPQGGITSSYLALLCLYDLEPQLVRELSYKKMIYTRYVDDITISSKSSIQRFDGILKLVEQRLLAKGLTINSTKVESLSVGLQALAVHGLNVALDEPVLPKAEIARVRLVCRQTELDASEVGRRTFVYRKRYNRAMGLVNKLARVKNPAHSSMVVSLRAVSPLPSFVDYKIATDVAHNMRAKYVQKSGTYWYVKRFNKLMARLSLISAQDPGWARTLRTYMVSHYSPTAVGK